MDEDKPMLAPVIEGNRDELIKACREGDVDKLKSFFSEDLDTTFNLKYLAETTPLHEACYCGQVDCVTLLLEHGVDANIYDSRGYAPIHCAASNNHVEVIKALLRFDPPNPDTSCKCTPDQPSEYGETPLHVACSNGHYKTADFLFSKENASLEAMDCDGNTILHHVSSSDSRTIWSWIIKVLDSDLSNYINRKNKHGRTPAHVAASMGCIISTSALFVHKADFKTIQDDQNLSAEDVMNKHGCPTCFVIATGQKNPEYIPPSPSPNRELEAPLRSLSNGSASSPKVFRRSSITGKDRPKTMTLFPPSSPSHKGSHIRRHSNTSQRSTSSQRSTGIKSSSLESFHSISKENYRNVRSSLTRLSSASSEERIQAAYSSTLYEPPLDLQIIEPVCKESIIPNKSVIYCKEHNIKFSTKYFLDKSQSKALKNERELHVCIAAAMHLNTTYPSQYTISSPICFVSVKCKRQSCCATLDIPHAACVNDSTDKSLFTILSMVTSTLPNDSADSVLVESPLVKELNPIKVESLEILDGVVRFRAFLHHPSLFAVGIRNHSEQILQPMVPLNCMLFCMYKNREKDSIISKITIRMYAGLELETVTRIMEREKEQSDSELEEIKFVMTGSHVKLQPNLNNTNTEWELVDNHGLIKFMYTQVALTKDTDKHSYSHELSYPPHQTVEILPKQTKGPVKFTVRLLDSHSVELKSHHFIPYAPAKFTTETSGLQSNRLYRHSKSLPSGSSSAPLFPTDPFTSLRPPLETDHQQVKSSSPPCPNGQVHEETRNTKFFIGDGSQLTESTL